MKTKIGIAIFSLILLSAHFSYMNFPLILSIISLLAPFLFLYKKRFSLIIIQVILFLGTLEWLRATVIHVQQHMESGSPWLRLVVILGVVIIITAYATWSLSSMAFRKQYK